jgi:hypothetical protein
MSRLVVAKGKSCEREAFRDATAKVYDECKQQIAANL